MLGEDTDARVNEKCRKSPIFPYQKGGGGFLGFASAYLATRDLITQKTTIRISIAMNRLLQIRPSLSLKFGFV